jgi:hypothetical protein
MRTRPESRRRGLLAALEPLRRDFVNRWVKFRRSPEAGRRTADTRENSLFCSAWLRLASISSKKQARAGLAGLSRGLRSHWRIVIWSSKTGMSSRVRAAPALVLLLGAAPVPACSSDPHTIALLGEPVVDGGNPSKREPTGCTSNADCAGSRPFCNQSDNKCVECLSATQCPTDRPRCAGETHTCEPPCTSPSDCVGIDRPICAATGVCVQCTADTDCQGTPGTPHCNIRNGLCVECNVNADCGRAICIDDCYACVTNACMWRT